MKKIVLIGLVLLLNISLFGCTNDKPQEIQQNEEQQQVDEEAIVNLVEDFGKKLQTVSLLAPKELLNKSIEENYGDSVSPALLEKWINGSQDVPGRLTSSPWPDRIEILSMTRVDEDTYEVKGEIIEITSVEKAKDGIAAKQPITLNVEKIEDKWLIDDVLLGDYVDMNTIIYENTEYGFNFTLPKGWEGYKIITEEWEGLAISKNGEIAAEAVEAGPQISIRHPEWTSEKQRQDIPIMIFTLNQWKALENEEFHIGAAPINPKELGRNKEYVFALPARYNFAFPTGYEEVEDILESTPLHPIEK